MEVNYHELEEKIRELHSMIERNQTVIDALKPVAVKSKKEKRQISDE